MTTFPAPRALIISNADSVSNLLEQNLQESGFLVVRNSFEERLKSQLFSNESFDYLIVNCVTLFDDIEVLSPYVSFLEESVRWSEKFGGKVLFIFPRTVNEKTKDSIQGFVSSLYGKHNSLAILYASEPIESTEKKTQNEANTFVLPEPNSIVSIISGNELARNVTRSLFSLRAYGKEQSVIGFELKSEELARALSEQRMPYRFSYARTHVLGEGKEEIKSPYSIQQLMLDLAKSHRLEVKEELPVLPEKSQLHEQTHGSESTYQVVSENIQPEKRLIVKNKTEEASVFLKKHIKKIPKLRIPFTFKHPLKITVNKKTNMRKRISYGIGFLFLIVILPYLFSFTSFFLAAFVTRGFSNAYSDRLVAISGSISSTSQRFATFYLQTPVGPVLYNGSFGLAEVAIMLSEATAEKAQVGKEMSALIRDVFSGKEISVTKSAQNVTFLYDSIYANSGFAIAELETLPALKKFAYFFINKETWDNTRLQDQLYKQIIKDLPTIFGEDKKKVYAVVLQNSSVIRPTGGRIEGFALLTFEHGSLQTTEVFPLENSDNHFAGSITAPSPLAKYLKVSNWNLRDSNWDYSFPDSALKIEWFLDKEFDRKVDGVIVVSDTILGDIMDKTGHTKPKNSDDWNSILSEGTSSFVEYLKTLDNEKFAYLENKISQKEMIAFISPKNVEEALDQIGWVGKVSIPSCGGDCYSDGFGIFESNFGEKAPSIEREAEFHASFEEGLLKRNVSYYIKNEGSTTYKTYLRLAAVGDAGFSPIIVQDEGGKKTIEPELFGGNGMKESGIYLEIPAGKTQGITYLWESTIPVTLKNRGRYELSVFKQPGVSSFPIALYVDMPPGLTYSFISPFLTKGSNLYYNTVLTQNISGRIEWNKDAKE